MEPAPTERHRPPRHATNHANQDHQAQTQPIMNRSTVVKDRGKYAVRIEPSGDSYRMILEHHDAAGHLEAAARHLSFGERNAFALVLFMHHVRRDRPDLVVLDDPVSSFDKTKKFAILHKLFHGRTSLRSSTTLLLTHDIEPVIDVVRTSTSGQFEAAAPTAHFLRSRDGYVEEKQIQPANVMTFSQVCDAKHRVICRRCHQVHLSPSPLRSSWSYWRGVRYPFKPAPSSQHSGDKGRPWAASTPRGGGRQTRYHFDSGSDCRL